MVLESFKQRGAKNIYILRRYSGCGVGGRKRDKLHGVRSESYVRSDLLRVGARMSIVETDLGGLKLFGVLNSSVK